MGMVREHYEEQAIENERRITQKLTKQFNMENGQLSERIDKQKKSILSLEQQVGFLEKEKDRANMELDDITIERDEWKSKFAEEEKKGVELV